MDTDLLADLRAAFGPPSKLWFWTAVRDQLLADAEAAGIRWCARCGRDLHPDQRLDALFCSRSCRVMATHERLAAGIHAARWHRPPPALGDRRSRRFEDWPARLRQLKERHSLAFTLCHPGLHPDRAPEVCRRWGRPALGLEEDDAGGA